MISDLEKLRREPNIAAKILLGREISDLERISGTRNNGVYRISSDQESFALKFYRKDAWDHRDRMGTEVSALRLMNANSIKNVPTYVAHDDNMNCALFRWVTGEPITTPNNDHFRAATNFATQLRGLSNIPQTENWHLASDACLSVSDVTNQTRERLCRFQKTENLPLECRTFIDAEFQPEFEQIFDCQYEKAFRAGIGVETRLRPEARILSPSDFGFHNAVQTCSGDVFFLDFEYFGLDAPFKLICDFALHPGMALPESRWAYVIESFSDVYGLSHQELDMVHITLPLFALRWCMIMLNVYLRNDDDIGFTEKDRIGLDNLKNIRLKGAGTMLDRARALTGRNIS